jgi:hypothetical protein
MLHVLLKAIEGSDLEQCLAALVAGRNGTVRR